MSLMKSLEYGALVGGVIGTAAGVGVLCTSSSEPPFLNQVEAGAEVAVVGSLIGAGIGGGAWCIRKINNFTKLGLLAGCVDNLARRAFYYLSACKNILFLSDKPAAFGSCLSELIKSDAPFLFRSFVSDVFCATAAGIAADFVFDRVRSLIRPESHT